uniref:Uncharacterized protein n=1 Tax=Anguilla anguilla TaxID=7936 RepID=A0A0E9UVK6_ANGAN
MVGIAVPFRDSSCLIQFTIKIPSLICCTVVLAFSLCERLKGSICLSLVCSVADSFSRCLRAEMPVLQAD